MISPPSPTRTGVPVFGHRVARWMAASTVDKNRSPSPALCPSYHLQASMRSSSTSGWSLTTRVTKALGKSAACRPAGRHAPRSRVRHRLRRAAALDARSPRTRAGRPRLHRRQRRGRHQDWPASLKRPSRDPVREVSGLPRAGSQLSSPRWHGTSTRTPSKDVAVAAWPLALRNDEGITEVARHENSEPWLRHTKGTLRISGGGGRARRRDRVGSGPWLTCFSVGRSIRRRTSARRPTRPATSPCRPTR